VLQKCITLDPKGVDFYQLLIVCHQKASDWNEAFKVLDLLESAWSVSPKTIIQRQELFHQSGNIPKAKKELKWELKYDLDSLIDDMVSSDLQLFKRDDYLKEGGHKIFQYHE
jgi:nucleoside-diphosphate-sugar epimerase